MRMAAIMMLLLMMMRRRMIDDVQEKRTWGSQNGIRKQCCL